MNEIEEYLLMIYLAERSLLTEDEFEWIKTHNFWWNKFKKEELGRTLPDTFEFYISQRSYHSMREDEVVCTVLDKKKDYYSAVKIKITVVEDD